MAERIGVEPIHESPRVRFSKPLPYRSANAPLAPLYFILNKLSMLFLNDLNLIIHIFFYIYDKNIFSIDKNKKGFIIKLFFLKKRVLL